MQRSAPACQCHLATGLTWYIYSDLLLGVCIARMSGNRYSGDLVTDNRQRLEINQCRFISHCYTEWASNERSIFQTRTTLCIASLQWLPPIHQASNLVPKIPAISLACMRLSTSRRHHRPRDTSLTTMQSPRIWRLNALTSAPYRPTCSNYVRFLGLNRLI